MQDQGYLRNQFFSSTLDSIGAQANSDRDAISYYIPPILLQTFVNGRHLAYSLGAFVNLMINFLTLVVLGLAVWFWQDSLRARERAIQAAGQACKELGAQLLDQTVSLESIKPARNKRGRIMLNRIYGFDFSIAGYERRSGRAFMAGLLLEQVQIDAEQGTTIDMKESS